MVSFAVNNFIYLLQHDKKPDSRYRVLCYKNSNNDETNDNVLMTQESCTIPSGDEKMLERTFSKLYSVQSQICSGHIDKVTRKFTAPIETI